MTRILHIVAAGAITSLGHDVERTVASLRSGLDRFKQVPFVGSGGADLVIAPIEGYADGTSAIDRYEALALKALLPCLEPLTSDERQQLRFFVGLPSPSRPGVPPELAARLGKRLADRLRVAPDALQMLELGRASVLAALAQARHALGRGQAAQCVVGGVDVLVNGDSLRGLSEAQLLKEQWDGFIPGEAAAFVRISLSPGSGQWGVPAAAVHGIGLARDAATGSAKDPLVGVGVCAAFRAAVRDASVNESVLRFYVNDVNGARAGFEDAAMGYIRFSRTPKDDIEFWHLASHLGETGAAVGALELIWAGAAHELGFAPDRCAMLAASEGEYRTAALLVAGAVPPPPSPHRSIGIGVPAVHVAAATSASRVADVRALRLAGEDLHGELLAQNFRELGWLWSLRLNHHRVGDSPWADIEIFEQRLLTHLDAIAWAGAAGRRLALDRLESPDLDEVAAAALVLLSFADERDAAALFEATVSAPASIGAIAAVVPHMPALAADPLIRRLVSSERPVLIAAGLRCLAIAGRLDGATADRMLRWRAPEVVAELIHAAGSVALTSLWPSAHSRVREAFGSPRGHVDLFAYLALAPPDDLDLDSIREMLVEAAPVAAALMCLRDDSSFCELVTARGDWGDPTTLDAAGWSGEPASIPRLLAALRSCGEADAAAAAAAAALHRLTGLALYEDVPAAAAPGDDTPSAVGKRLARNPAVWAAALRNSGIDEVQRRANAVPRLRHGLRWSSHSALAHLQRAEAGFAERLVANWEHALIHRAPLPCYPSWFIVRQRARLRAGAATT